MSDRGILSIVSGYAVGAVSSLFGIGGGGGGGGDNVSSGVSSSTPKRKRDDTDDDDDDDNNVRIRHRTVDENNANNADNTTSKSDSQTLNTTPHTSKRSKISNSNIRTTSSSFNSPFNSPFNQGAFHDRAYPNGAPDPNNNTHQSYQSYQSYQPYQPPYQPSTTTTPVITSTFASPRSVSSARSTHRSSQYSNMPRSSAKKKSRLLSSPRYTPSRPSNTALVPVPGSNGGKARSKVRRKEQKLLNTQTHAHNTHTHTHTHSHPHPCPVRTAHTKRRRL